MKTVNLITLALLIIGGINWGFVAMGGHEMDFVANIFGDEKTAGARLIYALVGLSALWQILPWSRALRGGEHHAEAADDHGHARPAR
jgi:hypothetical protein